MPNFTSVVIQLSASNLLEMLLRYRLPHCLDSEIKVTLKIHLFIATIAKIFHCEEDFPPRHVNDAKDMIIDIPPGATSAK